MDDWISVEDRTPDSPTVVLISVPSAREPVWLGFYTGSRWYYPGNPPIPVTYTVTAWKWRPEPAEGVTTQ